MVKSGGFTPKIRVQEANPPDELQLFMDGELDKLKKTLNKSYIPARFKESELLLDAGYKLEYDDNNQFIKFIFG